VAGGWVRRRGGAVSMKSKFNNSNSIALIGRTGYE